MIGASQLDRREHSADPLDGSDCWVAKCHGHLPQSAD
jgi:hypothetical protein